MLGYVVTQSGDSAYPVTELFNLDGVSVDDIAQASAYRWIGPNGGDYLCCVADCPINRVH